MTERKVIDAKRKIRRDIKNPLAGDFNKYLAEILLNADDSYKRLENGEEGDVKEIRIHLDRKKRLVKVVDEAEGMGGEELNEKFGVYGADQAGGDLHRRVRGLFGQGASDVLFSCAMSGKKAVIESIKDDAFHKCTFIFRDEKYIKVQSPKTHLRQLRTNLGIEGNGTAVTYGLPKEVRIPKKKDIVERIETFPLFRYILANPSRRVLLFDDAKKKLLSSDKYMFSEKKPLLKNRSIAFRYEGKEVKGMLDLYLNPDKKRDGTHVIIKDERDAVYDNTLFGLEKYPGANEVSGELEIPGLYSILKAKLNDGENPLQILTDSRDGFDSRNEFTKTFFGVVAPVVEGIIKKKNAEREDISVPLERIKRFRNALKKLNDYYRERMVREIGALSPGMNPPATGMAFAREKVSITEGKRYVLQLFVNAHMVEERQTIDVTTDANPHFTFRPATLDVDKSDADEKGLIVKSIALEGREPSSSYATLQAVMGDMEARADVNVVREERIYPEYGLEFIPKNYTFLPKKKSHLKLYFDMVKYPPGTEVTVTIVSRQTLFPEERLYVIDEEHEVQPDTGLMRIPFETDEKEIHHTVTAEAKGYKTKARIKVEKKKPKETGKSGFLNSIQLTFEDDFWQSSFNEREGIIHINGAHPINRTIMGELGQKDPKRPTFTQNQNKYLFELIAHESAQRFVETEFAEKDFTPHALLDFIQKEKTAIYNILLEEL